MLLTQERGASSEDKARKPEEDFEVLIAEKSFPKLVFRGMLDILELCTYDETAPGEKS